MDAAELRQYEQQLAQVRATLQSDPNNEELRNLEAELDNLVSLTKQLQGDGDGSGSHDVVAEASANDAQRRQQQQQQHVKRQPHHQQDIQRYAVGDECQAKYNADGRWYAARVVAVGGSLQSPMYTVLFKGYSETEIVPSTSLRPSASVASAASVLSSTSTTSEAPERAYSTLPSTASARLTTEEEAERERKRKRSDKKAERFANRTAEANAVQNSWQKFAKKAEKKKTGSMFKSASKSMFKTPDDPLAKVGVVGAGRGMTQYGDRKKHTYDGDDKAV